MATESTAFLASRRWPHHAAHSGYDLLTARLGTPLFACSFPARLRSSGIIERLARGVRGYDATAVGLELRVAHHMARHTKCLYHMLYGDDSYNHLASLVGWRGHRVIASYHHPPAKLAEWVPDPAVFRALSGAIVLGSNQVSWLTGYVPPERVFFVPYGVDTDYFRPDSTGRREEDSCLFVGTHLRDFDTLRAVIQNALAAAPRVRFTIVGAPGIEAELRGLTGRYVVRAGINDDELRHLYRTAMLLVLPLHDAVANNAILEAMACGLPLVVTDIGAVRDYADERTACFVRPYDARHMLDTVVALLGDAERRAAMSFHARTRAEEFAWPLIAARTNRVYEVVRGLPPKWTS